MKIGLIRHFKVDYKSYSPFYYPDSFRAAMKGYDEAEIITGKANLHGIDWEICFSSSYKRALETAQQIFNKEIIITDLLREVSLNPFTKRNIKLPWFIWHIGARIAWSRNSKSQEETKLETLERIQLLYSKILESKRERVLVVSHGFFMKSFSGFLLAEGFNGKVDLVPQNGQLYIFEKH